MRKSERFRLLELQVVRMQFEIELLQATLQTFLDTQNMRMPDLDSGKWYNRRTGRENE
jgi:hypothetical protein